ncbi:MAG: hypothetical protein ACREH4_01985 [Vitreimonas sp.]
MRPANPRRSAAATAYASTVSSSPDIDATNGVIQGINSVLTPPVLVAGR